MKRMRVRILIVLWLAASGGLFADDRAIAEAYRVRALALMARNDAHAAAALLEESIDYYPRYSETLYLLGTLYATDQETTRRGIELVEKALAAADWSVTPVRVAEETLIRLYVRTKRFREALERIDGLRRERTSSPALEALRGKAFYGRGDRASGSAVFERALELYPNDRELYRRYIQNLLSRGISPRARTLVVRARREFPDDPEFVYFQFYLTDSASDKKDLFNTYTSLGGKNPRLILLYPDAGEAEYAALLEMVAAAGGFDDLGILEALLARVKNNPARHRNISARLEKLDGEKIVDENADGYYEEKYFFARGRLTRMFFDFNQDGLAETEIFFDGV
ncbi:MAG TPA: tetratricopeptide repeat protein, partial [Spirochaetia bacterium]|nr:tetratricopeptide repeat protein [Spirochaetia bacterium]